MTHKSEHHPSPSTPAWLLSHIIWRWVGDSTRFDPDNSALAAGDSNWSPVGSVWCDSALWVMCAMLQWLSKAALCSTCCSLHSVLWPLNCKSWLSTICAVATLEMTQKGVPMQDLKIQFGFLEKKIHVTFIGYSFKFSVILLRKRQPKNFIQCEDFPLNFLQ